MPARERAVHGGAAGGSGGLGPIGIAAGEPVE